MKVRVVACKVDTAWANRVESDRFFNPNNMVCPVWNGMDNAGRSVCPDSFVTKTAGCNSAEDRVLVENDQRPQYMEYINLSANGFGADLYGNTMPWQNIGQSNKDLEQTAKLHGSFGQDWKGVTYPACGYYPYQQAMAQNSQAQREQQALEEGFYANRSRGRSGF